MTIRKPLFYNDKSLRFYAPLKESSSSLSVPLHLQSSHTHGPPLSNSSFGVCNSLSQWQSQLHFEHLIGSSNTSIVSLSMSMILFICSFWILERPYSYRKNYWVRTSLEKSRRVCGREWPIYVMKYRSFRCRHVGPLTRPSRMLLCIGDYLGIVLWR